MSFTDKGSPADRAAARVRADLSGIAPGKWERRHFMVMQAFFDESGNAPDQEMIVVGGLLASAENWIQFTRKWVAMRTRAPGADYVKYSELVRGEGQFADSKGWDERLRTERLSEIAALIKEHCVGFIYSAMEHRHFQQVQRLNLHHRNAFTDLPYSHVAMKSIGPTLAMLLEHEITERCDFYFDKVAGVDVLIQSLWPSFETLPNELPEELVAGRQRPVIGSVRFEKDNEFEPLQAADIIAGMMRDVLMIGMTHKSLKPLEDLMHDGQILDESDIRLTAEMMQAGVDRIVQQQPSIKLFAWDPATAARTRKYLERKRREAEDKKS